MGIDYNDIWRKVISPNLYKFNTVVRFHNDDMLKKGIKKNFDDFYTDCFKYMSPDIKILDRHKVSACLMYAIIKTDLFDYQPQQKSSENKIIIVSEQIAIMVGLSLLRTYIVNKRNSRGEKKNEKDWELDKAIFKDGFKLPGETEGLNDVNHGDYRDNLALELHFTKEEGTYNILSLSNTLYLLEMYNRHLYEIQHNQSPL